MKWRLYKEKLLWLRLNQGWSQEEAADHCGAPDKKTYHLWETGKIARPQARNLQKMIGGFGLLSTDELILKPAEAPAPELAALYSAHFQGSHQQPLLHVLKPTAPPGGYKLVCFDMDATLIHGLDFSTRVLWEALGNDEALRKQGVRSYYTGKFTYAEWCLWITEIFRQKGLTLAMLLEIVHRYHLAPNLLEGLQQLKETGYKLAIVSNGLHRFLDELLPEHKRYFDHVFINRLLFDDHGLVQSVIPSSYSIDKKLQAIQDICRQESLRMEEVIFVGSSFLNRQIAFQVGLTIAYAQPSREITDLFDVVIKGDDFREVVKVILKTQQR